MLNQCGHKDRCWMGCVEWIFFHAPLHFLDLDNFLKSIECGCNSFERSPIQHISWWPHWLCVRLQMSDGCCSEFNSHWRQLFSVNLFFQNLFVWQIFCQICLSWKTRQPQERHATLKRSLAGLFSSNQISHFLGLVMAFCCSITWKAMLVVQTTELFHLTLHFQHQ